MKPASSTAMKIGTHNETKIAAHVKSFLLTHASIQTGMVFAAFSPDHIAVMLSAVRGQFYTVLEYKTRVVDDTQQCEQSLADTYGALASVQLVTNAFDRTFKDIVPEGSHWCRILHNVVCGGVRDGFLVYATPTRIIRIVHVYVGDPVAVTYRAALHFICEAYMKWVYDDTLVTPYFSLTDLGHCSRGRPLPPAKHIIPSLIALWNRVKGGIDVYSRYLKNVKSRHTALAPTGAIFLRILMTLIYNAHQSHQLFQVCTQPHPFLNDNVRCTSYTSYQNFKQNLPAFAYFCRDAAKCLSARSPPAPAPSTTGTQENTQEIASSANMNGYGIRYKKRAHFNSDQNSYIADSPNEFSTSL
ncbi:hypothetical protein PHYSODRAFT_308431 [Phytophthora sojae]|uniref:Uncharacterized protein n=1 Tax=Phytophthora sojae (strain P6497) TaxID=1094619 RepID=G4YE92_PHYSP|nr:hypothetical protein PHYSODRAFT_308431 [Phytophthora sojae]EGZ26799.1 hypothetical protein PHYSODRAFT_308431 [Phytophthora sojae]|eukprot:XP_009514074.1 hypothetical protein PHYSODRAFT_308431 [Phytophthora sojae]